MYKTVDETVKYAKEFRGLVKDVEGVEIVLAPPFTALHAAAHSGNTALVQLLLAMGADPALVNAHRKTAADLALEAGFMDLAAALRQL